MAAWGTLGVALLLCSAYPASTMENDGDTGSRAFSIAAALRDASTLRKAWGREALPECQGTFLRGVSDVDLCLSIRNEHVKPDENTKDRARLMEPLNIFRGLMSQLALNVDGMAEDERVGFSDLGYWALTHRAIVQLVGGFLTFPQSYLESLVGPHFADALPQDIFRREIDEDIAVAKVGKRKVLASTVSDSFNGRPGLKGYDTNALNKGLDQFQRPMVRLLRASALMNDEQNEKFSALEDWGLENSIIVGNIGAANFFPILGQTYTSQPEFEAR